MELILGILQVLAIFVVMPVLVAIVIVASLPLWDRRASKKQSVVELVCSIDADCPPGFVCANGYCVPAKA